MNIIAPVVVQGPVERKQWIIVRKDIAMEHGKMAAQVAHASLAAVLRGGNIVEQLGRDKHLEIPLDDDLAPWLEGRFTKVVLEIADEPSLSQLFDAADKAGFRCSKIVDSGLTVFNGIPTLTCVGLGPHKPEEVKHLIGHLKTYRTPKVK